jgi:Tfp pilus assembly protein FimV
MPSFNLYRGSLLAMLIGTALAVFLILRPAGDTTGASPVFVGRSTPTATAADGDQPTIAAQTPQATNTPRGTPTATAEPTEPPYIEYVVEEGDTLFSIAEAFLPPGDDLTAYVQAIANFNQLDIDNPTLDIGQTLLLPRPAP